MTSAGQATGPGASLDVTVANGPRGAVDNVGFRQKKSGRQRASAADHAEGAELRLRQGADPGVASSDEGPDLLGYPEGPEIHLCQGLADDARLFEHPQLRVHEDEPAPLEAAKSAFPGQGVVEPLDPYLHARFGGEGGERTNGLFGTHPRILAQMREKTEKGVLGCFGSENERRFGSPAHPPKQHHSRKQ